jgi:hypothetical protein
MTLRLDWCSHEAAKFAVEKWHYSRRMPMPPLLRVGVWEEGRYIGCVLFGRGASPTLGKSYGLAQTEVCELVRIALTDHKAPVTKIVAVAVKLLRKSNPGLRMIVSFADPAEGHHGGIYQGGNWVYTGESNPELQFFHEGRWKHRREITSGAFGGARKVKDYKALRQRLAMGKHRYLMPLDDAIRKQIEPLRKPYPKQTCAGSTVASAPAIQAGEGGAAPTPALHIDTMSIDNGTN